METNVIHVQFGYDNWAKPNEMLLRLARGGTRVIHDSINGVKFSPATAASHIAYLYRTHRMNMIIHAYCEDLFDRSCVQIMITNDGFLQCASMGDVSDLGNEWIDMINGLESIKDTRRRW